VIDASVALGCKWCLPRGDKFKRDFWLAEVTKMIKIYGALIDQSDVGKIVDYLAASQ
jgi:sulfite dehydrogenase (cytochrome) subunit B